jgi:hypothetical protein
MREIVTKTFQLLLDELGIDEKRQFTLIVITGLAGIVVYSVRERHRHGLLVTALFTLLSLAALVFLFTDSEAARHWSALTATLSIAGILFWEFFRRRRLRSGDDGEREAREGEREAVTQ